MLLVSRTGEILYNCNACSRYNSRKYLTKLNQDTEEFLCPAGLFTQNVKISINYALQVLLFFISLAFHFDSRKSRKYSISVFVLLHLKIFLSSCCLQGDESGKEDKKKEEKKDDKDDKVVATKLDSDTPSRLMLAYVAQASLNKTHAY